MSILIYLLLMIVSFVVGFAIAFIFYELIIKIIDAMLKRKIKKLIQDDTLKPDDNNIERGKYIDERNNRLESDFREFEKLRNIAKGESRVNTTKRNISTANGLSKRGNFPTSVNIDVNQSNNRTKDNKPKFEFY